LPSVHLERSPRMADFAHVLAAVDQIEGTDGLNRYRALAGELARDAVTSDPVLLALTSTISIPWDGPAAELLDILTATLHDGRPPKGWPSGARVLTSLLKRRAPSLRRLGWTVEQLSKRGERGRLWQIDPPSKPDERPDEIVSSAGRQDVRQAATPVLACKDVESGWIPDELTNKTPNLSVLTEQSKRPKDVPDSSSSRQSVSDCLACGEPLAADLIADDIRRHIGCAA